MSTQLRLAYVAAYSAVFGTVIVYVYVKLFG